MKMHYWSGAMSMAGECVCSCSWESVVGDPWPTTSDVHEVTCQRCIRTIAFNKAACEEHNRSRKALRRALERVEQETQRAALAAVLVTESTKAWPDMDAINRSRSA